MCQGVNSLVGYIYSSMLSWDARNAELARAADAGIKPEPGWPSGHLNKRYDLAMRRLITSAAVVLAIALLAPVCPAQVRGAAAPDPQQNISKSSVVPARPLGHAGVMPTPIGVSPAPAPAFPTPTPIGVPPVLPVPGTNNLRGPGGFRHHHHDQGLLGGAYPVYVPVPVVVDPYSMYEVEPQQPEQDAEDQAVVPGPTVFERRAPADVNNTSATSPDSALVAEPTPAENVSAEQAPQPAQPQDPSVLVFRDGHQLEVQNYAIVGDTLYDLTPGHARKVPLSQLDLPATVKANDDRGVDFVLPASVKGE